MTIAKSLKLAAAILRDAGVAQPEREAASLLMFAIKRDRTFLIAHNEYELTEAESRTYSSLIARRQTREPFQHIVRNQEFYRLDFVVSPDVLIPRHETELLVEAAIEILNGKENARILDIGTGSGCIAVSILHNLPTVTATAIDISESALAIAKKNADTIGVAGRIRFLRSDLYQALDPQEFEIIVSNPPYIPAEEFATLQAEVRDFDPIIALTDGADGLSIIRKIVADAPRYLSRSGHLLVEIGFGQAAAVAEMFDLKLWVEPVFIDDMQGIARIVKSEVK
ncbi:MAG: peptide chain release factor N(5)-glutamine methyltransferase [Pyrinomonadaceae bacterium]|nr:peptide chain release factor N(5)-glutamine methyltransferase [Acidobacteriota bacterium]MBK7933295.1 peptide chain release factor N(5)-glutamine methyltransferase [Acidobacteriota bacterium]MBP7374856.1 peptide chain release factor N(5)-glutamine methyltransferase [Pyrinomonadaceae bacterium]